MDSAANLEKTFSEEEVKNAIMGMDGTKALGPGGFSMLFFLECSDTIKVDLMNVFLEFFE